jgi:sugar lactone lactonase YvrE
MRGCIRPILALVALSCATGVACGGGGGSSGSGTGGGASGSSFPQGFLPVRLSGAGRGDLAFRSGGDLYVVDGSADVTAVSRSNGANSVFSADVGGVSTVLRSVVVGPDGRVFVGDNGGKIWSIPASGGSATLLVDTATGAVITGLAVAPSGFGSLGGSLVAAAGASGILDVTTGSSPTSTALASPGETYVDVAFSGTTLLALDASSREIDTVTAGGAVVTLPGTAGAFSNPVGMAVDDGRAEILVTDAGDDILHALPVTGAAPSDRAPYDFDANAPSGVAYDGVGTIAFVARGSVVVRGSAVPRIDPAFGVAIGGPTVGWGDLELDRDGAFVLVANHPAAPTGNFLFHVSRAGNSVTTLATNIGASGEMLVSLAVDPVTQAIYIGTDLGNVYRRSADGTVSLLASASANAVLGLEIAPAGFTGYGGKLVATTDAGELVVIDPLSPTPVDQITPSQTLKTLPDLVFSSDGTLYVLENDGSSTPRLLRIAPDGTVNKLNTPAGQLGRPDGIEIDEGGKRLLVASSFDSPSTPNAAHLLAVALGNSSVSQIADINVDEGFFPTGVVYDRLGTAIYREGDSTTSVVAVPVF